MPCMRPMDQFDQNLQMTVTETLAELVAIDSVSAQSNTDIISYLAGRCETLGLKVRRFSYIDAAAIEKTNLIALAGAEFSETTTVELALVGHTDVVPYDPSWRDATTLDERDHKLYGRGACDTKGFIAAALTAVESVKHNDLSRPLALIFTADEEIGCLGAKHLAERRPLRARYAIVGEPTSLQPIRAGKGYCLAEVIVRGREGHSAYPDLGASAIFRAARLISELEKIGVELKSDMRPEFDPPHTTLNVGLIHGGTAKNIIAGECRFTLEWRPVPDQEPTCLIDLLQAAIAAEQVNDPDLLCEVITNRIDGGFKTDDDSSLVEL